MKTYGTDPHKVESLTIERLEAFEKLFKRMIKKLLPQALKVLEFKAAVASRYTAGIEDYLPFKISEVDNIRFDGINDGHVNVSVKFNGFSVYYPYKVAFSELISDEWKEDYCAKEALLKAKELF